MALVPDLLERDPDAWLGDDGCVYTTRPMQDGRTKTVNLTHRFQNARRETANLDILLIEAEILDDTGTVENPAHPINPAVKEAALERIEGEGLEPAWVEAGTAD